MHESCRRGVYYIGFMNNLLLPWNLFYHPVSASINPLYLSFADKDACLCGLEEGRMHISPDDIKSRHCRKFIGILGSIDGGLYSGCIKRWEMGATFLKLTNYTRQFNFNSIKQISPFLPLKEFAYR